MLARWRGAGQTPTIEERVAYMEGRFEDCSNAIGGVQHSVNDLREDMRQSVAGLREDMNRLFGQVQRQFEQVQLQFEHVERRFEQVDRRFEQVDVRFIALDQKVDRHFTWLVGIQLAVLVSVVGALVGSYYR